MKGVLMLFVLFSLLFVYERKAINMLMAYIGMTIAIAILIANNLYIRLVEGEYISYILILVQVSALTILFGFIIMLYPSLSLSSTSPALPPLGTSEYLVRRIGGTQVVYTFVSICTIILVLFSPLATYITHPSLLVSEGGERIILETTRLIEYTDIDISLLRRIGEALYTNDVTILKLMIVTTILLVAIVGLFFLISL